MSDMIGAFIPRRAKGRAATTGAGRAVDVILHLGAHRCATTTLQTFLGRNADTLATAGIDLWLPARTRTGLFNGMTGAPTTTTSRRAQRATGLIRIEVARAENGGTRQLIVSAADMNGT